MVIRCVCTAILLKLTFKENDVSLLTPERVPVKVYKWDDVGAPALDKTAGCMMTIFKACLITGYGTKEAAGWTMPFEDTAAGVKVLRPEVGPHTDFFLRLSADNGTQVTPQVYLNMTDANTGNLKLQCNNAFKYAKALTSGKWLLIASNRGFWFFSEQRYSSASGSAKNTGSFFICGDLSKNIGGERAVFLQHTGGSNDLGFNATIFGWYQNKVDTGNNWYNSGKLMHGIDNVVTTVNPQSVVNGSSQITNHDHIAPVYVIANKNLWLLPAAYVPFSGAAHSNLDTKLLTIGDKTENSIIFGTGAMDASNLYITTDGWDY